jgi:SAM-dependent methyltransferase
MDREVFAAHSAVEERHWWFAARRRILRSVVDAVTPRDRRNVVLDIGCGVGATLAAFQPDYGCIGYDPSPDAIEFGRLRHPGIDLRVGMVSDAASAVASVDAVLLNDVIEHVPDDRALLAQVAGAMRPGVALVVTVPADMALWSPHDVSLGHYRRYDPEMLREAVAGLPLETLFVSHFNARLYPLVRAARWLARRRGAAAGAAGTDLKPTPEPANALLRWIFQGEGARLLRGMQGKAAPYARGVSLIAVYRRIAGAAS